MASDIKCEHCSGTGEYGNYRGHEPFEACSHCDGTGSLVTCDACGDAVDHGEQRDPLFSGKDYCFACLIEAKATQRDIA